MAKGVSRETAANGIRINKRGITRDRNLGVTISTFAPANQRTKRHRGPEAGMRRRGSAQGVIALWNTVPNPPNGGKCVLTIES